MPSFKRAWDDSVHTEGPAHCELSPMPRAKRQTHDMGMGPRSDLQGLMQSHLQPSPEGLAFLQSLSSAAMEPGCSQSSQPHLSGSNVTEAAWLCFAELNVAAGQNFKNLPAGALLSYHMFTRQPKPSLWNRFVESQRIPPAVAEGIAAGADIGPQHMRVMAALMAGPFRSCPEAVVTRISAHMPPWLTVWAVKWGLIAPSVTLLQLEFFSGNEASGSSGGSTRPARVVYIPYYGDA